MRSSRILMLVVLVAAPVVYLACSSDNTPPAASTPAGDSGGADTAQPDGMTAGDGSTQDSSTDGSSGGITRGPTSMDFDPAGNGDPISLHWDDARSVLYIADNRNNQVWSWTDAAGFTKLVKVLDSPAADDAGRTNLGQIVELSDGTLVVPRFGFGSVSSILYVDPVTGDAGAVPGTALNRKRTALAVGDADQLWGGYFFAPGDHLAVVTKDSLTAETDYAHNFEKPVGVLVQDGHLLVSDQTRGIVYALPLDGGVADGGPYEVFASVASCDALTGGPGGTVFTGQFKQLADGGPLQIRQAFPDGGVHIVHPEFVLSKPQGVAYDKTNKRLFIADSNGTTTRTVKIVPID